MSSMVRWDVRLRIAVVSAGALLFAGCVGQAVVGEEDPEGEGTAGDGDGDEGVEPVDCSGAEANQPPSPVPGANDFSNLAGTTWEGYYEGGDDVTLILGADGTGSFYVGDKGEFSPPTDPDVGYLCDRDVSNLNNCYEKTIWDGYEYSVESAEVSNRRLQFQVVLSEPWEDWCGLQTPQRLSPNNCSYGMHSLLNAEAEFTPNGCYFGAEDDPARDQVDCDWGYLALQRTCTCNAQECFGSRDTSSLDLTANEEFTELSNLDGLRLFLVE